MRFGGRQRKWLLIVGLAVLGFILLLLAVPLWFPWVVRPLARKAGATYQTYQRLGYGRFALRGFTYTNQSLSFHAASVEAKAPTVWGWQLEMGARKGPLPFLQIEDWRLGLSSGGQSSSSNSTYSTLTGLFSELDRLQKLIPLGILSNGTAVVQHQTIAFPSITLSNGELRAEIVLPANQQEAVLSANLHGSGPHEIQLVSHSLSFELHVALTTNAPGLRIEGSGQWWTNQFTFQAQFARTGSLPVQAGFKAPHFSLPSEAVHLSQYRDITGSVLAKWASGNYAVSVKATAQPLDSEAHIPPIDLGVHTRGDTKSLAIETAEVSAPWLTAKLSKELRVYFSGPMLRAPAELNVSADLARQPWMVLTGVLNGRASFTPGSGKYPRAHFSIEGEGIGTSELKAKTLQLEGGLDWPWLALTTARASFSDGSTAAVEARLQAEQKRIEGGHFTFAGPLAQRWLPAGYSYKTLSVAGRFEGPLTNIAHQGEAKITGLRNPLSRPLSLAADWKGTQENLKRAALTLGAGGSWLSLEGGLEWGASRQHFALTQLTLRKDGRVVLALAKSAELTMSHPGPGARESVRLTPLDWQGPGGEIHASGRVEWPVTGSIEASARHLTSRLFEDFLSRERSQAAPSASTPPNRGRGQEAAGHTVSVRSIPAIALQHLSLSAGWTNGPVSFTLAFAGAGGPAKLALGARLNLTGSAQGMNVRQLEVTGQSTPILSLSGFLPLAINPLHPNGLLVVQPHRQLSLSGSIRPTGALLNEVAKSTGLHIQKPYLRLRVGGTPEDPSGQLQIKVRKVALTNSSMALPPINSIAGDLQFNPSALRLTEAHFLVATQLVEMNLQVPFNPALWAALSAGHHQRSQGRGAKPGRSGKSKNSATAQVAIGARTPSSAFSKTRTRGGGRPRSYPMRPAAWAEQVHKSGLAGISSFVNLQQATGQLRVKDADLAALEPFARNILVPQGRLRADVRLLPGLQFGGQLSITNARTRPLPSLGPIRDINLELALAGRDLGLKKMSARIGGAPVRLSGSAALGGTNWLKSKMPPFKLTLQGTNVPLAREPAAVIRGNLNLLVAKTNGAPPLVSGQVDLHNSFFLSDLSQLVPGKVASPEQRPPYFSIKAPLLENWRLGVHVTGAKFLKVQSTLFNGLVSANLNLDGTLRNPVALGDVRINSGTVRFPFGNLDVTQGLITISPENPYTPKLQITAGSKQFGYDIKMEVTGTAQSPAVQFTSTPPLSSEQIVMLLTAGQIPGGTFSLTAQQRAQALAIFLARDFLAKLGLGQSAEQRLTIRSGEEISESGKPTYHVEFKLTPRWSLVGEYDRFSAFNGGFKWRVYSK